MTKLTYEEHHARATLMGKMYHAECNMYFTPELSDEGFDATVYIDADSLEVIGYIELADRIRDMQSRALKKVTA